MNQPTAQLWTRYELPMDLAAIESVALADRGLPESTYALLTRAAEDGVVVTTVDTDPGAVSDVLGRYAIEWRTQVLR
ncbi:hypothetical protein [Nocardia asteroides]